MNKSKIIDKVKMIENKIIAHRRFLHKHAESGFSLEKTFSYVFDALSN